MGKFTISTGPFSIAMLNYQRVNQLGFYSPSFCYCEELTLRQLWSQSHEELRGSNNLIDFLSSALDPWTRSPVAWGELSMTQHDTTWHDIHNMYVRIICICGGTVKSSPWEGLNGFFNSPATTSLNEWWLLWDFQFLNALNYSDLLCGFFPTKANMIWEASYGPERLAHVVSGGGQKKKHQPETNTTCTIPHDML